MSSRLRYLPHDTSVLINNDDPDLRAIRLSLPEPPPLASIAGYGLPIEDQRFKRIKIPPKLDKLRKQVLDKMESKRGKNRKFTVTLFKIQEEYWRTIDTQREYYAAEIEWIKRMWWHRMNGYWFFNRGKPTYITGWHFMYLNFWYMPDVKPDSYPHYRDRDRKEFIFHKYTYETTETFTRLSSSGMAIRNDDGTYDMTDLGKRVCYGPAQSKNRRSGNTNKGLSNGVEIVTRTIGTDGMGIMSYTGDNAESHFKIKLIPAWDRYPMFFMPYCVSPNNPSQLSYTVPSGEYSIHGLQTGITYASTASSKFYDGKKLVSALLDEEGKTENIDIDERWDVVRMCMSQGNGAFIHGYAYHPSTVEDYSSGGAAYRRLMERSSFYNRIKTSGQTPSGLFRMFMPADEGLDSFIDSYGYSVKGEILDYQREEGFTQTATEYLEGNRDYYKNLGTPEGMEKYRNEQKLFPLKYADSWLGETGDIGFDIQIIDNRIQELHREPMTRKGDFKWEGGVFGGNVVWEENLEHGRFEVSRLFDDRANRRIRDVVYDPIDLMEKETWSPMYPEFGTMGVDPFKFKSKAEIKTYSGYTKHGMSEGGITGIWEYDHVTDAGKIMSEWESYEVICTYRYRPATDDELCEDALKAAIWYGMMVYPEMNISLVYKKFREWGYLGYLKYDVNADGVMKNEPGTHMLAQSKQEGFSLGRNFIKYRGHKMKHLALLMECKNIQSTDDLTNYDLLASFIVALLGTQSKHAQVIRQINEASVDIGGLLQQYRY